MPAFRSRATPRVGPRRVTKTVSLVNAVTWTLSVTSGFCLAFLAFLFVLSPLQQGRAQDVLYGQFRTELAAATAPFGVDPIEPGAPIAILDISALGVRQVVVEGTAGSDLRSGPGHARATALPGQEGTSLIFGRSTTYGAPFGSITSLQTGQRIRVVTGQGAFVYKVEDIRRNGDLEPPALKAGQARLTLVTTEGEFLRPASTVYVDARLVGDPGVTPPRDPVLVPPFEGPMASDTSALLPLVLWLLALIGTAGFVVWGSLNWGRLQTWTIAAPVALAVIWGTCDSAALLLPNLM